MSKEPQRRVTIDIADIEAVEEASYALLRDRQERAAFRLQALALRWRTETRWYRETLPTNVVSLEERR